VGIFFDPPYGDPDREAGLYEEDGFDIAERVEAWCLKRYKKKSHRIVVAGYDTKYEKLVDAGWRRVRWSAQGGYASTGKSERGKTNRHREMLFVSPHCKITPILRMIRKGNVSQ